MYRRDAHARADLPLAARTASDVEPAKRLPVLDGVRGLAILLVLAFHFKIIAGVDDTTTDYVVTRITTLGWTGVNLFFVLSGFLITGILYDSKSSARAFFRTFYTRRTLRIFPAYYLMLVALMFVLPLLLSNEGESSLALRHNFGWYGAYLTNLHYHKDIIGQHDFPLVFHLWSLAVEEQFYLLWPAFVFLFGRRQLIGVCGLMIIGALILRAVLVHEQVNAQIAHGIMPAHMDALGLGALLALVFRHPGELRLLRRIAWPALLLTGSVVGVLFCSMRYFTTESPEVQTVGYSAIAVLYGSAILLAATSSRRSWTHRAWTFAPLTWLGKYSYALYLVHWPVATLLAKHATIAPSVSKAWDSPLAGELVFMAAATGISLGIAIVSWYVWEQPFLMLKERTRFGVPRTAPMPARTPALEPAAAAGGGGR